MFWKSYLKSKNFLFLLIICFIALIAAVLKIVITLIFGNGSTILILISVIVFIFFSLIAMLFSFIDKHQYETLIPKYYIIYNNDNIKYYFIGYIDTRNGEITFSDDLNDAMLYISMKKINILIEILKNDYSLSEDNIVIGQLEYKEAYKKWEN